VTSSGFSQRSRVSTNYPLFPRQLQFKSDWTETVDVEINSGYAYNTRVGLFDFLNQIPMYAETMFELYRYCRICAVDVRLQVAPEYSGTGRYNSFECALSPIPSAEALAPPTMAALRVVRGSKYALSSALGQNRVDLRGHWGSFDQLGNPTYSKDTWQTASQAASTTIDGDHPVIFATVRTVSADTQPVCISLTVTYHMQWFDLEIPDGILVGRVGYSDPEPESFEEALAPVPVPDKAPARVTTKLSAKSTSYVAK